MNEKRLEHDTVEEERFYYNSRYVGKINKRYKCFTFNQNLSIDVDDLKEVLRQLLKFLNEKGGNPNDNEKM